MRPQAAFALLAACAAAAAPGPAEPEMLLSSPGFPPSRVDESGTIHEDWGQVRLEITSPGGAVLASSRYERESAPTVVTVSKAGDVTLTQVAYRAPIWPAGVDVLTARVRNEGSDPRDVVLVAHMPEGVACGDAVGVLGGRPVIGLPQGIERAHGEERAWGCTGGVVSLPGWARPAGDCDPAFKNIRAGMGGVPIVYRFAVQAGTRRRVVLGFCESHWDSPGVRPLVVAVEGTPRSEVDPIAEWGRHMPGCLAFDAADADRDGRLQVAIEPHPQAADTNTILNAIWVFPPGGASDTGAVLRGAMTEAAEYYVDVGGEKDQLLYKEGSLKYALTLPPEEERELTFLLASPGGGAVPNPVTTVWTPASLRKAAVDVWKGYATWPVK